MSGRKKKGPGRQQPADPITDKIRDTIVACSVCDAQPVVVITTYTPHRLTPAGKKRTFFHGLCADCWHEVTNKGSQPAALAAIERRFEPLINATLVDGIDGGARG